MVNVRFCYNARGSLNETVNHLKVALDLGYLSDKLYQNLRIIADEIRRMLYGYIEGLKTQKLGEKGPGANISLPESAPNYLVEDPRPKE